MRWKFQKLELRPWLQTLRGSDERSSTDLVSAPLLCLWSRTFHWRSRWSTHIAAPSAGELREVKAREASSHSRVLLILPILPLLSVSLAAAHVYFYPGHYLLVYSQTVVSFPSSSLEIPYRRVQEKQENKQLRNQWAFACLTLICWPFGKSLILQIILIMIKTIVINTYIDDWIHLN